MKLTVVIPTLGDRAALDGCLARLRDQRAPGPFDVLLVADAAAPDVAALERRFADAGLPGRVLSAVEPGASAARNAGWRATDADVVLFLDDDVWADPGLVGAHRGSHEADPRLGSGAIGRLRWASGLRVTPFMRWVENGLQFDTGGIGSVSQTGWWHLYTCNCSLKREALARVGGLDAAGFPFGYEDLDLGRRLHDALPGGLRLEILDAAGAEHAQEATLGQWRERVGRIARSERRFVARYPGTPPHFRDRFAAAMTAPAPRGRAARLAPWISPWVPWVGARVHEVAGFWYEQQLAAPFLAAWEAAAGEDPGPPPPAG